MTATTFNCQSLLRKSHLQQVQQLIGRTPLYELTKVFHQSGVRLFAKLEWQQLGESVKSRPAWYIIKSAVLRGELDNGRSLLDATSGNTGIAYTAIGAALGIPATLCLPENASKARKQILGALGAGLVYTSRFDGTDGAQLKALEMAQTEPDRYFYADQYNNVQNWKAHLETTAPEIWQQTQGRVTHFVAGLGTTGTLMGVGRGLRNLNPAVEIIGLQPDSPLHGLEGWKHIDTAKVPGIFDRTLPNRIIEIGSKDAHEMVDRLAKSEGLFVSPSAAANLVGAIRVASQLERGVVVTTFADTAGKYLAD